MRVQKTLCFAAEIQTVVLSVVQQGLIEQHLLHQQDINRVDSHNAAAKHPDRQKAMRVNNHQSTDAVVLLRSDYPDENDAMYA